MKAENISEGIPVVKKDKNKLIAIKILCFFIPLVAIVLFFVWRKKRKEDASSVLWWGACGFAVSTILSIM